MSLDDFMPKEEQPKKKEPEVKFEIQDMFGRKLGEIKEPTPEEVAAYKEKQEAKADRYLELAGKAKSEAQARHDQAERKMDAIPFGQPILVGHYSEGRDRRFRDSIDRDLHKSVELGEKADYYARKAENAASDYAIRSEDPEALKKLKQKVLDLDAERVKVKAMSGEEHQRSHPNWHYDHFFTGAYMRKLDLESIGRRIRDAKKRAGEVGSLRVMEGSSEQIGQVEVVIDPQENRIRLHFPGKPSQEVRSQLKSLGFRWSPTNMAWQTTIRQYAIDQAKSLLMKLDEAEKQGSSEAEKRIQS